MSQRSVLLDKSTQTDRVIDRGFHQFTQTDNLALYARLNYTSVKDGVTYGLVEFATLQKNVPATARYQLHQSQASQQVEPLDGTGSPELLRSDTSATQLYRTASTVSTPTTRVDASSPGMDSRHSIHSSERSGVASQSSTTSSLRHVSTRHDTTTSAGHASPPSDMDSS